MTDEFSATQASVLIGTAEKMIEIWNRLSPEKQAALLARFGSEEKRPRRPGHDATGCPPQKS
ncbi:hypothetical protein ACFS4T_09455 [Pseudomonas lini]